MEHTRNEEESTMVADSGLVTLGRNAAEPLIPLSPRTYCLVGYNGRNLEPQANTQLRRLLALTLKLFLEMSVFLSMIVMLEIPGLPANISRIAASHHLEKDVDSWRLRANPRGLAALSWRPLSSFSSIGCRGRRERSCL